MVVGPPSAGESVSRPGLDAATTGTGKLRTSQLALPQDVCETGYATEGYEASVANLASVGLDSDMVFSDG
jgi:hypothetical protein